LFLSKISKNLSETQAEKFHQKNFPKGLSPPQNG